MQETLRGFSRGMYSNWLWHRPLQLLIDAGEGLQIALGSNVFSPSVLAITHGHSDHVLGLPGLLAARRFGKGAVDKPLTIVFPEGSVGVQAVREYLGRAYADVVFPLNWIAAAPGTSTPIGKNKQLEAITVRHTSNEVALGYRVVETRKRLKPAFASMTQADIEAAARQGTRDDLLEDVRHVVFAHSGDAMPIDPALVTDADVLVHDATFLNEPDRREPIHATTEEALDVATRANVKTLVLYHLSIRYDRATALPALRAQVAKSGFAGECWLLDEDSFVKITKNE
ncbi:MAG: MBL fold metallo-hydrolase [Cyanobacteria bacterium]|nr:MBL fold metallo-hydrolase [Cyanobacteriota bacterium]